MTGAISTGSWSWPPSEPLDEGLLRGEEREAIAAALERLSERDRRTLLAHEVGGPRHRDRWARSWVSVPARWPLS